MKRLAVLIGITVLVIVLSRCISRGGGQQNDAAWYERPDGYVGESMCISCHKEAYNDWKGSHHDWAMKVADESTVLGDFSDRKITLDGVDYYFHRDGDSYLVQITEVNGSTETYEIQHTFGVDPLQQYITSMGDGKRNVLRVSWDTDSSRWYHQYAGTEFHPDDWLHWTEGGQRWNTMCADCHSTDLKRNYDWKADTFHTTWSSINVSCEGCHGPGKAHVEWAATYRKGKDDGALKYILAGHTQTEQIDQCAPCHARRTRLTENMQVAVPFHEQFILQTITPEFYHPDGQIREEDYVTGSFLQSQMYHEGVKCTDCHNPHSAMLKMTGNDLCMSCHEPKYNTIDHHFHKLGTAGAECVSCHMTGEVYMGHDFRRDHSFRVPRPDQSVQYGTPNACTGCHTDQTNEWAAEKVVEWYGPDRKAHFSDALLLSTEAEVSPEEQEMIRSFINDPGMPAIARATAVENYSFAYSVKDYEALILAMKDSSALVRYRALTRFLDASPDERYAVALEHISDPSRLVRVAAARLLEDAPDDEVVQQLSVEARAAVDTARKEYEAMLYGNLDFPVGRLQLGDHFFRKGQVNKAVAQYEKAIEMDSLLTQVYANLATAYSRTGNRESAMETLDKLIFFEPEYARGYYLRGLLHYEMKEEAAAITDLTMAADLDPYDFRAHYNLATLHYQRGEFTSAERVIEKALRFHPDSQEGLYLLALIYRDQGRAAEADAIMQYLNAGS